MINKWLFDINSYRGRKIPGDGKQKIIGNNAS